METKHEDLGDLPLLGHVINQSPLVDCLDQHFPVHGNWRGPSVGRLVAGWLMYIISECDHRLYTVESWAQAHLNTLRQVLGCAELESSAFQDDRLGKLLEQFGQEERYLKFVSDYNGRVLKLYDLEQCVVRVDSFNAPSYRQEDEQGLFHFGYHNSHQADLPHLKTMLVTLDPLALPVATYSFAGNESDDLNYIAAIKQARQSLRPQGLLYVGDTKMGSLENRAYLAGSGNYYLCPLSHSFYPRGTLWQGIEQALADPDKLYTLYRPDAKSGKQQAVAQVYELPGRQCSDAQGQKTWNERLILALSIPYAEAQEALIRERLKKAKTELFERFLPRKFRQTWTVAKQEKAQDYVQKVLQRYKLEGLLEVELVQPDQATPLTPLGIRLKEQEELIQRSIRLTAWRLYVTNAPLEKLPLQELLNCYREEYRIEHQFHRLLTKTTALLPIYLKEDKRIVALLRLLTLALQFVTLIQHTVRRSLQEQEQPLSDLIPGNKNRKVSLPTTELMLRRFKGLTAIWVQIPGQPIMVSLKNIAPIHYQILKLLHCPEDLYERLLKAYRNVNELV